MKKGNRRTVKTSRRSALPVRMSYRVNVRSVPVDARMDDSDQLNLRAVMDSVDVGNRRVDTGADLVKANFQLHYMTQRSG